MEYTSNESTSMSRFSRKSQSGLPQRCTPLRPLDGGEELLQVPVGLGVAVAGQGAEDELEPRLVDEHEGVGVDLLEAHKLLVDPAGHHLQQKGPHRVVKENGPVVLVLDVEAEADGPFQLPPDGRAIRQVHFQKLVIHAEYCGEMSK